MSQSRTTMQNSHSTASTAICASPPRELSRRERECLAYAARGMTSGDISLKLGIAERTVNFHFANAIVKLGTLNRLEAIAAAIARRIIALEDLPAAGRRAARKAALA
jgi:DNA-binding CsgD family transcriptional regulator